MEKVLLSVSEFMSAYNIGRTATYEEIKDGRLKIVKRGTRTFIAAEDARAWLDALRSRAA